MKKYFTCILLFAFPVVFSHAYAQTLTNVEALNQLAEAFAHEWQLNQQKVLDYTEANNVPVRQELEDGRVMEMVNVIDGRPVYYITDNLGAAHTTRAAELWEGGSSGLDISGEGYSQLGSWDAGHVRKSHQEFMDQGVSRAIPKDGSYATHYHSTHVAGTLIAAGVVAGAKGMSYGAELQYWQWTNDESEMATAGANGLEISNHSYGYRRGWNYSNGSWQWNGSPGVSPVEDYKFGFYDGNSRQWDQIAFNAPNYLIVKSAGNDRGDGPSNAGQDGNPEKDGGDDGYDCIGLRGVCKNIMTVGAVLEVSEYTGPESVVMSGFSGWGPADDGRIKPDVVGKGVNVYSTMDGSNTSYASLNGTSMSSPNVAGSMALLQKYYQDTNAGTPMRAATLKGLVLHTADEAGNHPGPDYVFGWGLMNAKRSALRIKENTHQVVIDERVLEGGDIYMRDINVPEGVDLRVTICWTDPAGTPVAAQLNPRDPMLVNDLDLSVEDASFTVYYPYKLDYDNPSAAATNNTKNYVDNVEMVFVPQAAGGTYTIKVTHDGALQGDEQAFSLIITGIDEYDIVPECTSGLLTPQDGTTDILLNEWLSWEAAEFASSYDVYFGTDGGGIETPTDVYNGENFPTSGFSYVMDAATTYYLQVVPRNNQGPADSCGTIWSFTTMEAISQYPYLMDVSEVVVPEIPQYWQSSDSPDTRWESTKLIGHSNNRSMMCWNPGGVIETEYDSWLVSPPFSVEAGDEYNVSYYYKSFLGNNNETLKLYWGSSPNVEDLTNLIFEDVDFADPDWRKGNGLYIPAEDGLVFFGWHVESLAGYGIFLDDMMVDNWGTVGLGDEATKENVSIFGQGAKIIITSGESWKNAELKVVNMRGQIVYSGLHFGNTVVDLNNSGKGLYIVSLQKGTQVETKKLIVR
ncbi:MAG: S8 family serine peptidase [Bacteroidales bacterium]|nr:S8 family serine peptidase [Bacteroidales bacterium]